MDWVGRMGTNGKSVLRRFVFLIALSFNQFFFRAYFFSFLQLELE